MESFIIFAHVVAAVAITGLVLIQHGKGADMGASFGSGASQTMFGSSGSGNVLTKSTTILAIVFFVTSLGLAIMARERADQSVQDNSLIENIDQIEAQAPQTADPDVPTAGQAPAAGDIPELDAGEAGDIPEVETNEAGDAAEE